MSKFLFHSVNDEIRFCKVVDGKIINNDRWKNRVLLKRKDVVLFVDFMSLNVVTSAMSEAQVSNTGRTAVVSAAPAATAATGTVMAMATAMATPRATAAAMAMGMADWKKANDLWKKDKKIPGGIFLTPSGDLIWISEIDQSYFEQAE